MGKRAPEPEPHVNHERWLLSYADFITLLMIFFIVLYSMSSVSSAKYEALTKALNQSLGGSNKQILTTGSSGLLKDQMPAFRAREMTAQDAYEKAVKGLEKQIKDKKVTVTKDDRGAVIRLSSDCFFTSGSAELNKEAKKVIYEITALFDTVGNNIQIEGHTDNLPIKSSEGYASNWELGAQRAINVVKALDEEGIHHGRLSAASYADTRPLNSSGTSEGNAKNRRVEIIILTPPPSVPVDENQTALTNSAESAEHGKPTDEENGKGHSAPAESHEPAPHAEPENSHGPADHSAPPEDLDAPLSGH